MNNPPAFPQDKRYVDAYAELRGMTLRDYFAAAALPLITRASLDTPEKDFLNDVGRLAYQVADAMLKAREQ